MRNRAGGVFRALAVLSAIWALLGLVALIAGVLPAFPGGSAPEGEEPTDESAQQTEDGEGSDGEEPDPAADDDEATAPAADGGPPAEPAAPPTAFVRWTVCDAAAAEPSLRALQVMGSPTPELSVGCDAVAHLIALEDVGDAETLKPARVVTFDAQSPEGGALSMHAGTPAAGDVDGDSLPDLVLPFWQSTADGTARGGRLYLVRQEASGAFGEPRLLGPIAAVSAELAQLDARPGLDIVALNRGNELARRPSEAWVFAGGAAPVRSAVVRSGVGGRAVATVDFDRDQHTDLVTVSKDEPRVDVFFGDGTGRFPRSATVQMAGGTELATGDLDSDGAVDVLVRAEGLHLIRGGSADSLEPHALEGPEDLRQLVVVDLGDDGKRDIVGLSGGTVMALRQTGALTFEAERLLTLEGTLAHRLVVADLDGNGRLDAAILAREANDGPWELIVVRDLERPRELTPAPAPAVLPDAPLVLRVTLQ